MDFGEEMFTFNIRTAPSGKRGDSGEGDGQDSSGGIQLQVLGGSAEVRLPRAIVAETPLYKRKMIAEWADQESVEVIVPTPAHVEAFAIALQQLYTPTPIVGLRPAATLPLVAACKLLGIHSARVQATRLLASHMTAQRFIPASRLAISRNDVLLQELLYLWAKRTALGARESPKRSVQDARLYDEHTIDSLTCGSRGWSKGAPPSSIDKATSATSAWVGTGLGVFGWAAEQLSLSSFYDDDAPVAESMRESEEARAGQPGGHHGHDDSAVGHSARSMLAACMGPRGQGEGYGLGTQAGRGLGSLEGSVLGGPVVGVDSVEGTLVLGSSSVPLRGLYMAAERERDMNRQYYMPVQCMLEDPTAFHRMNKSSTPAPTVTRPTGRPPVISRSPKATKAPQVHRGAVEIADTCHVATSYPLMGSRGCSLEVGALRRPLVRQVSSVQGRDGSGACRRGSTSAMGADGTDASDNESKGESKHSNLFGDEPTETTAASEGPLGPGSVRGDAGFPGLARYYVRRYRLGCGPCRDPAPEEAWRRTAALVHLRAGEAPLDRDMGQGTESNDAAPRTGVAVPWAECQAVQVSELGPEVSRAMTGWQGRSLPHEQIEGRIKSDRRFRSPPSQAARDRYRQEWVTLAWTGEFQRQHQHEFKASTPPTGQYGRPSKDVIADTPAAASSSIPGPEPAPVPVPVLASEGTGAGTQASAADDGYRMAPPRSLLVSDGAHWRLGLPMWSPAQAVSAHAAASRGTEPWADTDTGGALRHVYELRRESDDSLVLVACCAREDGRFVMARTAADLEEHGAAFVGITDAATLGTVARVFDSGLSPEAGGASRAVCECVPPAARRCLCEVRYDWNALQAVPNSCKVRVLPVPANRAADECLPSESSEVGSDRWEESVARAVQSATEAVHGVVGGIQEVAGAGPSSQAYHRGVGQGSSTGGDRAKEDDIQGEQKNPGLDTGNDPAPRFQPAAPIELLSRQPRWSERTGSWTMDFRGRVTKSSKKNFQLIEAAGAVGAAADGAGGREDAGEDGARVCLMFGKRGKDVFSLDFREPLSPAAAFGIALTTFATKWACA